MVALVLTNGALLRMYYKDSLWGHARQGGLRGEVLERLAGALRTSCERVTNRMRRAMKRRSVPGRVFMPT